MTTAAELFARARLRLTDAPREALGEYVERRPILGVPRAPRIEPRGDAWHLGTLLLTADDVLAEGLVVRAREEARRGYSAVSQRERAELAAAAVRGGFATGVAVHIDWQVLDVDAVDRGEASGPLALHDGVPHIRWSAMGALIPLEGYLDDRIALLQSPPPRA
jgi:hypothetical protein